MEEYTIAELIEKYELPIKIRKKNWTADFYLVIEKISNGKTSGTAYRKEMPYSRNYSYPLSEKVILCGNGVLKSDNVSKEPATVISAAKPAVNTSHTKPVLQSPSSPDSSSNNETVHFAKQEEDIFSPSNESEYNFGELDAIAEEYAPSNPMSYEQRSLILSGYSDVEAQWEEDKTILASSRSTCFGRMDFDTCFMPWANTFNKHYYTKVYLSEKPIGRLELLAKQTVWQVEAGLYQRIPPKVLHGGENYDEYYDTGIIIDWRAPIASIYYNQAETQFTKKIAKYIYQHDLMLKRRFESEQYTDLYHMQLQTSYDDDNKFSYDPFLIKVLEERKHYHQLRNIIQTIQAKQNEIIRRSLDCNIIVQGCAGSGKTMVMLHRLSVLLYNYQDIPYANYRIITPNKLFNAQIDTLSTNLDIDSIPRCTPEEFYLSILNVYDKKFSLQSDVLSDIAADQRIVEYVYSDEFRLNLIKKRAFFDNAYYKSIWASLERKTLLVINQKYNLKLSVPVKDNRNPTVDDINSLGAYLNNILQKLNRIKAYNVNAKSIAKRMQKKEISADRANLELQRLNNNAIEESLPASICLDIHNTELDRDIAHLNNILSNYREKRKQPEYLNIFREIYTELIRAKINRHPDKIVYRHVLFAQTLFCSIFSNLKLITKKEPSDFLSVTGKYLFIDEAQDYAPTEYRLFNEILGDGAIYNLYGDVTQQLHPKYGVKRWEEILSIRKDIQRYNLTENYRNTISITEFCNTALKRNDTAIGYEGKPVRTIDRLDFIKEIKSTLFGRDTDERKAIIVNDTNDPIIRAIENAIPGKYIINGIQENLISILSVEYAKGLEFDTVFVYGKGMDENRLYVAFTRALDSLTVCECPNIPLHKLNQ